MTALLYLVGVVLFVIGVAASIGLHEMGHLIPGKLYNVKVTQYFIGFGRTIWSRRRGETEYGIKAIPLGGYVKLVGMLPPAPHQDPERVRASNTGIFAQLVSDARSAEYEHVAPEDHDRLFYRLPWWKRVVIMGSGVTINLVIAFLPAAILGFLFSRRIKEVLFNPVSVAIAFIVGGLIILWVERRNKDRMSMASARVETVDDMTPLDALKVGIAQAFALIPGTSRSGATIIGGMMFGLSRKAATEFSFFLAIPTLLAATFYKLWEARHILTVDDIPLFGIGAFTAFVSAFLCVRWLLRYISSHDFTVFAWYRIVFGLIVLGTAFTGTVNWVK